MRQWMCPHFVHSNVYMSNQRLGRLSLGSTSFSTTVAPQSGQSSAIGSGACSVKGREPGCSPSRHLPSRRTASRSVCPPGRCLDEGTPSGGPRWSHASLMRPRRPLPRCRSRMSRYAKVRTPTPAIIAACCPGGAMPTSATRCGSTFPLVFFVLRSHVHRDGPPVI